MKRWILLLWVLSLLGGCKSELYSKLDEAEANEMLALLVYNKIPAQKSMVKEGASLQVDADRFVDAVEVLRHHGLPRRKATTMQDLFPSGQLVSSPDQEEAKLNYLKGQQLEKMLSNMDGVITADVSVAKPSACDGEPAGPASAAVFIKYSPEVNLPVREAEIRALIRNGIPGLTPEHITVAMQRAEYRYLQQPAVLASSPVKWGRLVWVGGAILLLALLAIAAWMYWRRPEAKP
ncbi:type III secretion associated protein [Burkholderia lata]|uniref:type III secretion system inner membrane ring lipoprotein SctJ n=1 Tax=Burkholderia lata (strain ATCC 17760 / DSM 23089 / LMG 22485 / NCIMB 9086 / R18194 / 383) TaxID=482957 RepID=UPI001454B0E4|nr:type III secretion inner membrane ring lipoprotein SctJ [Burkholderia lata]VWD64758.1 type III secretion associated protein [Burkholderia lata]